jgi:alkanesulfonate monooxygenase SsuD/methylene tetrahydromethanopterin reductase-like flavin-dependent oxidoreductase (luciferase family)
LGVGPWTLEYRLRLARASAVTQTLKLGTGICLIPEHHPIHLAKQVATLDNFSGGRFLFGIGAGWLNEETAIMGGDFAHRWGQTREAILAMKALWRQETAEFHGTYYDFPPVIAFPKPVQQPEGRRITAAVRSNAPSAISTRSRNTSVPPRNSMRRRVACSWGSNPASRCCSGKRLY